MLTDILRIVNGQLSVAHGTLLEKLIKEMPSGGSVLDLYPGEGRSTIIMASTMERLKKSGRIFAVDTHITNPRSDRGIEEGTLGPFMINLRSFKCSGRVTPIIGSAGDLDGLLNKKSVNLCCIQIPDNHTDPQALLNQLIGIAKNVIRKGGQIAVASQLKLHGKEFGADYSTSHKLDGLVVFKNNGA